MGDVTEHYNKLLGYNIGAKISTYDNLIFNDVDIIFKPEAINHSLEEINYDYNKIMHPYDGYVFGLKLASIQNFENSLNFDLLDRYVGDYNNYQIKTENENILLKNIGSTGGGLVIKRQTLKALNGFNPNFKGWGFEDDETKLRFAKLGYPFTRLKKTNPMIHLEHRDAKRSSAHRPFFFDNKAERDKINKMTANEIIEYSSSWNI